MDTKHAACKTATRSSEMPGWSCPRHLYRVITLMDTTHLIQDRLGRGAITTTSCGCLEDAADYLQFV